MQKNPLLQKSLIPLLFSALIIILNVSCKKESQNPLWCWVEMDGVFEWMQIDKEAAYLLGSGDLHSNLSLNYPAEARQNGIEGSVVLNYEITKEGEVENIIIVQDIGGGCGEAAQTALEEATPGIAFAPAELDGNPVRVRKKLNIEFSLE